MVLSSNHPVRRRGGAQKPLTIDDNTQAYDPFAHSHPSPDPARHAGAGAHDEVWQDLDRLPSIDDAPVVFDHRRGGFVSVDQAQSPKAPRPAQTQAGSTYPQGTAAGAEPDRSVEESPMGWQRSGMPASQPAPAQVHPPRAQMAPGPYPGAPPPPTRNAPKRRVRPVRAHKPRRRGQTFKRLVLTLVAFAVLVGGGMFAFGWWQFSKIEKVDVANVLSKPSGSGTNYLIVGSDSRTGIAAGDQNAGAFLGPGEPDGPARTDSIMILRVDGADKSLLSIPRDLYVTNPRTNQKSRINALYQSGPAVLIKAVQNLGIPVHHYAEINFVSFAGLVDAVGGIDVDFPFPTRDRGSGLDIPTAGVHRLDGVQGLAYARARHYEELKVGKWVEDPRSDLTRVVHQRAFLGALLNKVTATRNPYTLFRVASSFGAGLELDNAMTYLDALGLGWSMRGFNPSGTTIPTRPVNIGGAEVLQLAPEAPTVLGQFA